MRMSLLPPPTDGGGADTAADDVVEAVAGEGVVTDATVDVLDAVDALGEVGRRVGAQVDRHADRAPGPYRAGEGVVWPHTLTGRFL
jgi:hypothetical protein